MVFEGGLDVTRQLVLKQVIPLFYLFFWVSTAAADENFAKALYDSYQQHQKIPHLSLNTPTANAQEAYKAQAAYVKLRLKSDAIAGYKAGLTSSAGQRKFSVNQALSGVLFSSGHVKDAQLKLAKGDTLMLETELGFILKKPVTSKITELESLPAFIESVVAVIEIPNLGYQSPAEVSGIDLIASNVASHQFILGNKQPLTSLPDLNQLNTQLSYQNIEVFRGKATDALGDQWIALQWLINNLLEQGYQLSAGELLITGALGKMVPLQVGDYVADFDALGKIKFSVTEKGQ